MIKCENGCEFPIEASDAELGGGGRLPSSGVNEGIDLKCKEVCSYCSSSTKGINKGIQVQDAQMLETTSTITNSSLQQQHRSDDLKPILVQIPSSIPLGIDIDMAVPIVSYIQPYSPLRNHVSVGDIILVINGKNVMKWNHLELCSLFSGRPQGHCNDDNDTSQCPRINKLVFLPGKFMQKEHDKKLETNESIVAEASYNADNDSDGCVNDKVKSSPTVASTEPTTTHSSPPTKCISSSCFSSSLLSTPDNMITTKGNVIFRQTHQCKHSSSFSSPITAVTRTSSTSSSSSSVSSSIASSGGSNNVGNENDVGSHDHPEVIETISTNQELTSRGSIPFLDYLERKVGELNEKYNSKNVYQDSANVGLSLSDSRSNKQDHDVISLAAVSVVHQQQGTDSNALVVDDDSASAEDNECAKTLFDEDDIAGSVGVENSERTDENEVVDESIEGNGNESIGEHHQCKAFQDDNLDDRDRRRHERMNREQPQIEYVKISEETEPETDISTLYGGVWIKELNFTAHRVEDSIMNRMEEGERTNNVWNLNSQQPQLQKHSVKTNSSVAQNRKRNWIIDMIILTLIVLGVIGIIAIAAVFMKL